MFLKSFRGKIIRLYLDTSITVRNFPSKPNPITNIFNLYFKKWPVITVFRSIKSWIGWKPAQPQPNLKIHKEEILVFIIELLAQPQVNLKKRDHHKIKSRHIMIFQDHLYLVKGIFLSLLENLEKEIGIKKMIKQIKRVINLPFTLIMFPQSTTNLEAKFLIN